MKQNLPEHFPVSDETCQIFNAWSGREKEYLTVGQVAETTGLRASRLLSALDDLIKSGILETFPVQTTPKRYRVNSRPSQQQLQQQLQILKAIASSGARRDKEFAY
jgi:DNA-binding MarR family transcriptional regulator